MQSDTKVVNVVRDVVTALMDRLMDRVLIEDPFVVEKHHATKPLYAALVPDEIFKGSHFERRFVTPFGNTWERLAIMGIVNKAHILREQLAKRVSDAFKRC